MKVVLTGASGFIGGEILKYFIFSNRVEKITTLNRRNILCDNKRHIQKLCDLNCPNSVEDALSKCDYDTIIHCAGNPDPRNKTLPAIESHIASTVNLLNYCKNKTNFIYMSSINVYGKYLERHRCNEHTPKDPNTNYAFAKSTCEEFIKLKTKQKKIKSTILRCGATIGLNSTHGFIHDLLNKIESPEIIQLWGKYPGSRKPYMLVEDLVKVVMHVSLNGLTLYEDTPDIYNICNNGEMSITEIAYKIISQSRSFHFNNKECVNDIQNVLVSNEKMKQLGIKLQAPTTLEAIEYIAENIK